MCEESQIQAPATDSEAGASKLVLLTAAPPQIVSPRTARSGNPGQHRGVDYRVGNRYSDGTQTQSCTWNSGKIAEPNTVPHPEKPHSGVSNAWPEFVEGDVPAPRRSGPPAAALPAGASLQATRAGPYLRLPNAGAGGFDIDARGARRRGD